MAKIHFKDKRMLFMEYNARKFMEKSFVYKNLSIEDKEFLLKNIGKKSKDIGDWVAMKKLRIKKSLRKGKTDAIMNMTF